MSDDKMIRLSVLQMAQNMCDQEFLLSAERGGVQKSFPTTQDIIQKANDFIAFVDETTINTSREFLTENQVRASEDL
jgi:hypothetical protein